MHQDIVTYQTELSGNIVLLCRFLRSHGFTVSPTEETDALKVLSYISIGDRKAFKKTLKIVLCKNQNQFLRFDDLFEEFWKQLRSAADSKIKEVPKPDQHKNTYESPEARFDALKEWLNLHPANEEKDITAHSDVEILTKKNFSDLSEDEMRLMMRLLSKMARTVVHQKSRLRKTSKKRSNLDLRRTIRANMTKGGDLQELVFSEPKDKKLNLVLLCDVSKSMELYSRFFVHLIYAFQNAYDRIETFVFSTALHRVTDILDTYEFDKAFNLVSDRVPDWSGGTTIGRCLSDFVSHYSYKMLTKKTVVLILSDGWDVGQPELIGTAMRKIYRSSKKVIWLNPLAGSKDFSPEAIGMKSALPFIDVLASAHNLESLRKALQQISKRRKFGIYQK